MHATLLPRDTTILFRFVPGRQMFYSPYENNDEAIRLAARLIGQYREDITAGKAYILIRGFCSSFGTKDANLAAAKNRSNQVKSWFIVHHGMKEEYYRTRNSALPYNGQSDIVALMGLQYVDDGRQPDATETVADTLSPSVPSVQADASIACAVPDTVVALPVAAGGEAVQPLAGEESATVVAARGHVASPWYLKTNLLYDVLLMPTLEVEYRVNSRWSVALEGNMAWWHNNPKHKYYQIGTIVPEARYWFNSRGNRCGYYLGLLLGGGWYDLENGGRGYRGEGMMTGLTCGCLFPVGRNFAFEAAVGLGYLRTWYDEYLPIDGHYVYQQSSRLNYFGPVRLKLAWVWNLGN